MRSPERQLFDREERQALARDEFDREERQALARDELDVMAIGVVQGAQCAASLVIVGVLGRLP